MATVEPWVLGIDFGTSFTVAACRTSGRAPDVVEIGGERRMPSVVLADENGTLVVGRSAENLAAAQPSRALRAPKARLGEPAPVILAGRAYPVVDLVAAQLKYVYGEAVRHQGGPPTEVRLTHPAAWGRPRLNQLAEAAAKAGLPNPIPVPEPVAAAASYAEEVRVAEGDHVAVYDLGGGTFDTAVLQATADGFVVVGRPAGEDRLGGDLFDELVANHIGAKLDPDIWEQLQVSDELAWQQAAAGLHAEARRAKESLSSHPFAEVLLALPSGMVHQRITRLELEDLVRPYLEQSVDLLGRAISDAGLDPGRLSAIYLAGGASRTPLVEELVSAAFPVTTVSRRGDPKTAVALGSTHALATGSNPPVEFATFSSGPAASGQPLGPAASGPPPGTDQSRPPLGPALGPASPSPLSSPAVPAAAAAAAAAAAPSPTPAPPDSMVPTAPVPFPPGRPVASAPAGPPAVGAVAAPAWAGPPTDPNAEANRQTTMLPMVPAGPVAPPDPTAPGVYPPGSYPPGSYPPGSYPPVPPKRRISALALVTSLLIVVLLAGLVVLYLDGRRTEVAGPGSASEISTGDTASSTTAPTSTASSTTAPTTTTTTSPTTAPTTAPTTTEAPTTAPTTASTATTSTTAPSTTTTLSAVTNPICPPTAQEQNVNPPSNVAAAYEATTATYIVRICPFGSNFLYYAFKRADPDFSILLSATAVPEGFRAVRGSFVYLVSASNLAVRKDGATIFTEPIESYTTL